MKNIIYSNYNLWEDYAEDVRADFEFDGFDVSERAIWDEIYWQDEITWMEEFERLTNFFNKGDCWIMMGTVGLWTGIHAAGTVFEDFEKTFYEATKDCVYWELWDENGHFYLRCSHHDGNNSFEIKRLTNKGCEFIQDWEYDWESKMSEREVHTKVWRDETMTELPYYAHVVYGCPKEDVA